MLVKGRQVEFSFWPSRSGGLHRAIQTRLFALDPWGIIRQVVEEECQAARQKEALACLEQAEDFYSIGTGRGIEAAPATGALLQLHEPLEDVLPGAWNRGVIRSGVTRPERTSARTSPRVS